MIKRIAKDGEGQPANEVLIQERVELANTKPGYNEKDDGETQSLLPHERDQTTGRQGTSLRNENKGSRAVIGQAAEDTKRGLKDTERRGIPSDINASEGDGANAIEKTRNKP